MWGGGEPANRSDVLRVHHIYNNKRGCSCSYNVIMMGWLTLVVRVVHNIKYARAGGGRAPELNCR
jgi:3-dehydroquinate dehydratase